MPHYTIFETDKFLSDVEEAAVWILESNFDYSEDLAFRKLEELQIELETLKIRLQSYPETGEIDFIKGVRKFPVYDGRYSLKWIIQNTEKTVTLIALTDSRYPKNIRHIQVDEF